MQLPVTLHCKPRQVHELRAVRLACDRILASPVGDAPFWSVLCVVWHLQPTPDICSQRQTLMHGEQMRSCADPRL